MTLFSSIAIILTLATFVIQSKYTRYRTLTMATGVSIMIVLNAVGGVSNTKILSSIPWNVLVILASLNVFAAVAGKSGLFEHLSVFVIRQSKFNGAYLLAIFCAAMFFISSLVNNLTAILLCLPIIFQVLRRIRPKYRYCTVLFVLIIASCNLGGAATAIGDFPAILLLSLKKISFVSYTARAAVICIATGGIVLVLSMAIFYKTIFGLKRATVERVVIEELLFREYQGFKIDWITTIGFGVSLSLMLFLWTFTSLPAYIPALLGSVVSAVFYTISISIVNSRAMNNNRITRAIKASRGERAHDLYDCTEKLLDFTPIAFFFFVFFLVYSVEGHGAINQLAGYVIHDSVPNNIKPLLIVASASLVSALFSAGPGMAMAIPLAEKLLDSNPDIPHGAAESLYIGIALGICAGSCLFLTAATSGPLAKRELELAEIETEENERADVGFWSFAAIAFVPFCVILSAALIWTATFFSIN